jgi:3-hydroxyisobutyrate dehydrogenase-like beta-hydroxyacid dehydrogenase
VRIGFLGLGAMGSGIVRRLMDAGHDVTGWNRTKKKADELVGAGMRWADTPRAAADGADIVFSILTDASAMEDVLSGPDGVLAGLSPGAVLADMSTIHPDESRAFAERVAETGATMLDAPVSGSVATLEAGELSIMVGGDQETFERTRPVLLDIGPKVTHVGDNGQALVVKLAINLSLVVQVLSFCESVAMAEKAGVDPERAVDAILKSVIASPVIGYRAPLILGPMDVTFADVKLQQKDQTIGLALARSLGAATPFAALANEFLTATRAAGLGDRDFVAGYEVFRSLGGLT